MCKSVCCSLIYSCSFTACNHGTLRRDHRLNYFPGYDHHEWEVKRELAEDARALAAEGKTKVIAVYNGIFLEGAFRVRFTTPTAHHRRITETHAGGTDWVASPSVSSQPQSFVAHR